MLLSVSFRTETLNPNLFLSKPHTFRTTAHAWTKGLTVSQHPSFRSANWWRTPFHTAQTYRSRQRRLHEPRQVRTPASVTSRTASSRMSYFFLGGGARFSRLLERLYVRWMFTEVLENAYVRLQVWTVKRAAGFQSNVGMHLPDDSKVSQPRTATAARSRKFTCFGTV